MRVGAVAVERRLGGDVVRDPRVNSYELPPPVFEKLKHSESEFKPVVHNQVLQEFRVHAHCRKRAEQPLVV